MDVVKVCCYFSIKLCLDMQTTLVRHERRNIVGFLRIPGRNKSTENVHEKNTKMALTEAERSTWCVALT